MNVNKKFDFNVVVYHIKFWINWNSKDYSTQKFLKIFFFLNRLLNSVETRYWSIELKTVDIIWIFKKIRHLIESLFISTIIYINYDAAFDIIKQITLTTSFTNKLNFRFIRASNYIQQFNLKLRYKLSAQHIISNTFSRLFNLNKKQQLIDDEKKLNILFIIIICEMNKVFRTRFLKNYRNNSVWKKIFVSLNIQKINAENSAFFFLLKKWFYFLFW